MTSFISSINGQYQQLLVTKRPHGSILNSRVLIIYFRCKGDSASAMLSLRNNQNYFHLFSGYLGNQACCRVYNVTTCWNPCNLYIWNILHHWFMVGRPFGVLPLRFTYRFFRGSNKNENKVCIIHLKISIKMNVLYVFLGQQKT